MHNSSGRHARSSLLFCRPLATLLPVQALHISLSSPTPATKVARMAEETKAKAEEEVAVEEKTTLSAPPPPPEEEEELKEPAGETEKPKPAEADADADADVSSAVPQSVSFKEETNVVADLLDPEKKALHDLKLLLADALAHHHFAPLPPPKDAAAETDPVAEPSLETKPDEPAPSLAAEVKETPEPPAAPPKAEAVVDEVPAKTVEAIEDTVVPVAIPESEAQGKAVEEDPAAAEEFIWGVPLAGDERSDTVLLKFLRARDFKTKEAMSMLKSAVLWRKSFGIDALLSEDLGLPEMNRAVFMHGHDRECHPVCYNAYGELQDRELYAKALGDDQNRQRFLRWRIQFLEKGIRELLDFHPEGVCTMVQVNDLRNSPGPWKRELRQTTNQALALLQDNYPEFVAKQVFINVPWWYLAYNKMISPFLTQRTKSKFVFAGPSKSAETLFKYIAPEQVPVQYGGLSEEKDPDFTTADAVNEITIKPSSKQVIEIPVTETCLLVWELRVLGWDVTYGAEFAPSTEGGYTVIVQKTRKLTATDEAVVKNSFKIGEPGKIILTVGNTTSKKKKLLYRSKPKSSSESI